MTIVNHIIDDHKYLQVNKVKHLENYKLLISFSDGKNSTVDFYTFLSASRHPEIRKYIDINLFLDFKIRDGNLEWNDYDMIFPIEDLYNNDILHIARESVA
jgi:hypothetical protein